MNAAECLRILGVTPDASTEQIRQAYQDLVRVWHPDRFQSDARLQQIAQERLREINEAYSGLKNYNPTSSTQQTTHTTQTAQTTARATTATAGRGHPERRAWTEQPRSPRASRRLRFPRYAITGRAARTTLILLVCGIPFLGALQLVRLLRVPVVDAQIIGERALRPGILAPMRIIDPSTDVRVAADMMTEWARGDIIDLWRPIPARLGAHFGNTPGPPATGSFQPPGAVRKTPGAARNPSRPLTVSSPRQPANGTELIDARGSRRPGYLRVANHTSLEAVVKMVSNLTIRRAIYVSPGGSAVIRSVKIGLYDLHVELGNDLDVEHLRFRRGGYSPEPLGPFEFLEITSENGVTGSHYDVALNAK